MVCPLSVPQTTAKLSAMGCEIEHLAFSLLNLDMFQSVWSLFPFKTSTPLERFQVSLNQKPESRILREMGSC